MEAINLLARYYSGVIQSLKQGLLLTPGEILTARVHSRHDARHYDLQIHGRLLPVESSRPLKTGDQLQLQVTQTGNPVYLKIIGSGASETVRRDPGNIEQLRQLLLRQDLPRQKPLSPLFQKLQAVTSEPLRPAAGTPVDIKQLKTEIMELVLPRQKLGSPENLRKAFESSGLFLESRLAGQVRGKNTGTPMPDLKSLLLRLSDQLGQVNLPQKPAERATAGYPKTPIPLNTTSGNPGTTRSHITATPSGKVSVAAGDSPTVNTSIRSRENGLVPPEQVQAKIQQSSNNVPEQRIHVLHELRQLVDSGLSRIQVQQSHAVVSDTHVQPVWSTEIPVQDGRNLQSIHLSIREDSRHTPGEQGEPAWTAGLELDLGPLGMVQVRLGLVNDTVNASLWAEKQETADLISSNLVHLEHRLDHAGLKVDRIRCLQGCAPRVQEPGNGPLLDIQI
ncbi:MAG: flagellar hook-length control protein FliK [Gammaproteobacteria bacterium]|nr:flagellar hook-length control protein FliK [Gammaproteobacteria bacterium]